MSATGLQLVSIFAYNVTTLCLQKPISGGAQPFQSQLLCMAVHNFSAYFLQSAVDNSAMCICRAAVYLQNSVAGSRLHQ